MFVRAIGPNEDKQESTRSCKDNQMYLSAILIFIVFLNISQLTKTALIRFSEFIISLICVWFISLSSIATVLTVWCFIAADVLMSNTRTSAAKKKKKKILIQLSLFYIGVAQNKTKQN